MHFSDCIFLTAYKEHLLYCGAAGQFVKYRNVNEEWACGGCPIPQLLDNHFCIHLQPKRFLNRNGSCTEWFCSLTGARLFSPAACSTCPNYVGIRLGQVVAWRARQEAQSCAGEYASG
ncbi:MAG TPA: hypothetical protein GX511_06725 [Firmicutes bacterium]|nr:hypothetical protein [Bacillota bacterium]